MRKRAIVDLRAIPTPTPRHGYVRRAVVGDEKGFLIEAGLSGDGSFSEFELFRVPVQQAHFYAGSFQAFFEDCEI
jgi:hypothetical protein